MRSRLTWSDLPGRRVGIYGLGVEGAANLRACSARDITPVLVDDQVASDSPAGMLATAAGGMEALLACEVVIKTPGISPYGASVRALKDHGVTVVGGLGLWLAEADLTRVLCITGTKGKSTTTSLAGHLLTRWGYRVMLGGNLGASPWDPEVGDDFDYWVVEVSSYQATTVPVSPPVVVVTSLHPDHLPWHADDVETYYRDKLSLCTQPGAHLTVTNGDSDLLRDRAAQLGPQVEWVHEADTHGVEWIDRLGVLGGHNRRNALLALTALQAMGVPEASDPAAVLAAADGFQALEHRLTAVDRVNNVLFVDDSLSTNVLPTLAAVDAFPTQRIALIVGGQDRGIDYRPLATGLRNRDVDLLLLAIPDSGPRIAAEVREEGPGGHVTVVRTGSLEEAVRRGHAWAGPDGVVLLSPAAPSFGIYRDYKDRARAFAAAMETCRTDDRG